MAQELIKWSTPFLFSVPWIRVSILVRPQTDNRWTTTVVLEVANKEYGNFINVLSKAAIDCHWRKPESCIGTATLPHYLAYDRNHNGAAVYHGTTTTQTTMKADELFNAKQQSTPLRRPSEFTKLLILMRRCNIQLYRDWVCSICYSHSTDRRYVQTRVTVLWFRLVTIIKCCCSLAWYSGPRLRSYWVALEGTISELYARYWIRVNCKILLYDSVFFQFWWSILERYVTSQTTWIRIRLYALYHTKSYIFEITIIYMNDTCIVFIAYNVVFRTYNDDLCKLV